MSGNQNAWVQPVRRNRAPLLAPQVLEWKTTAMQRLGWQSRTALQTTTKQGIDDTAGRVLDRSMRGQGPASAAATERLRRGAGDDFKTYHDLRRTFESAQERSPEMVTALKQAAQAYIDHFNEHNDRRKRDPDNIAKRDACAATIKELHLIELAHQTQTLGDPPWDSVTAMRAASLKTSLALAMLPPGEQKAERLSETSASPTFWINERNTRGGKDKAYLLKPEANAPMGGFPKGGEPVREMMAGKVGDMLNGALGLHLGVPETQVVSIARDQMPSDVVNKLIEDKVIESQQSYVASVQQFEQTEGNIKTLTRADSNRVPTAPSQELAVLDIITLNTDRHGANFLVQREDNGAPKLVPIDHGLAFPPRAADFLMEANLPGARNALLRMPGVHEPFDPALQQSLGTLDPDVLAAGMKRERDTLREAHPTTDGTLSDESIEMSRRSALLLKRACTRLTPAAVQVAIARYNTELFDPALDAQGLDTLIAHIIDEMEENLDGMKEYYLMPIEMQDQMKRDLARNGWPAASFAAGESLLLTDPGQAIKLWKSGAQAPAMERDPMRRPVDVDENAEQELEEMRLVFPNVAVPQDINRKRALLEDWRDWKALGGTPEKLKAALERSGVKSSNRREKLGDLAAAVKALKMAEAIETTMANDTSDHELADLRHELAYLRQVVPALEPGARGNVGRRLDGIAQHLENGLTVEEKTQTLQTLRRLRDPLLDAARARMLQKYDEAIENEPDEHRRGVLKKTREGVEEFNVVNGYATLQQMLGGFADSP